MGTNESSIGCAIQNRSVGDWNHWADGHHVFGDPEDPSRVQLEGPVAHQKDTTGARDRPIDRAGRAVLGGHVAFAESIERGAEY